MQNHQESPVQEATLKGWDYLSILRVQWRIVAACVFVLMLSAVAVHFILPAKYEGRIITIPAQIDAQGASTAMSSLLSLGLLSSGGSANPKEVAVATLRARSFLVGFAKEQNIVPRVFPDRWDFATGGWKPPGSPTDEQIYDELSGAVTVDSSPTDNLVMLRVRWTDSALAASIANGLIASLNRHAQAKAVAEADRMVVYLTAAYRETQISELHTNLANLIQDQIRQRILAKSRDEYQLTVIDPAAATIKRVNPGLSLLLPAALFLGLMFGIPAAFLTHTLKPQWRGPLARLLAPRP